MIFGYDKPNRYTWAILMGFLEHDSEIMAQYDFHILPFQVYQAPAHEDYINTIPFANYDHIILAFSLMTIQMPQFDEYMQKTPAYFAKWHPNIIAIAGGPHVQARPADFAQYAIDFIIPHEGEIAFQQLLKALIINPKEKIETEILAGVARTNPQYIPSNPPELITLGDYPSFSPHFRLFGPIEISRGCPFRCKFCQTGNSTQGMRHAPVEKLLEWIRLGAKLKYDKLWFLSPNAFAYGSTNGVTPNIEALSQLLSGISEIKKIKGIYFGTFPSEVRPESVTTEVLETVTPFLANKKILVGAQTASNRHLKSLRRGHTIEEIERSMQLLTQFGFQTEVDFIFGLPGETEDDIEANLQFFEGILTNKNLNVRIHTHTFMPLPGTPFENESVGEIDPRLHEVIGRLAKQGKAYGEYQAQAGLISTRYSTDHKG